MDILRKVAMECVARGVGFGALAIAVTMVGFSYDPPLAARVGATCTTLMVCILWLKAVYASKQSYRRTELWTSLLPSERPPEQYAQWAAATVLRDTYLAFAYYVSIVAAGLWAGALALSLFGL